MPSQKRPCNQPPQDSPASKRHAAGSSNDDIIKLLKECSQKQKGYIAAMEQFLLSHKPWFQRLRRHLHYHLIIEMKRGSVRNSIEKQIEEYEKELGGLHPKETMLKLTVKEMSEQEDKLEKIVNDIVKHKGYVLQSARKKVDSEPGQYGPYKEELTNALQRVPTINRDDAGMEALPKLREQDLDHVEWPEMIYNWSQYSIHWNSEFEEATVCRSLNERVKILNEQLEEEASDYKEVQARKYTINLYDENRNCPIHADHIRNFERTARTEVLEQLIHRTFEKKASIERLKKEEKSLEASKKQREDLLKSIQEEMNTDSLKCSVCFEALTNGEQSLRCPQQFGSCGHTVCANCMTRFKAPTSPYHWTCHQCRAPSDKVLTNWTLMQLIKEVPGQPQREVMDAHQAVPIVPAPWRLEQREDREPILQEERVRNEVPNMRDLDRIFEDHRRRLEVLRAPVAPRPVVPPPRPWDPLVDPLAPAPAVPLAREPDQQPNIMPNMDDILAAQLRLMERGRHLREDINNRAAAARGLFPPHLDEWDRLALAPVPPPPMAPIQMAPPPGPVAQVPNFNWVIPPPQWQPGQFANLFPAVPAPPPRPPAPAPHAAPQAPQWMGADRNMDEDEEEDWDSDEEDDGENDLQLDWRSDEDEDEEDEEDDEDEPEDFPAAAAPQPAPVQWQLGRFANPFPDYWAPQNPLYRGVSPDGDSDEEDSDEDEEDNLEDVESEDDLRMDRGSDDENGGENDEDSDEDSDEDEEDNVEGDVDSGEEDAAPAPAPQAAPVDGDDLEILEVHIRAAPQVRQPAVQIEGEIEYIDLD
ncbi:unnamed protein product [Caenorhabditis brenneri]